MAPTNAPPIGDTTKFMELMSLWDDRRRAGLTVAEVRELAADLLGHPVPTLWHCTRAELALVRQALPDKPPARPCQRDIGVPRMRPR